MKEKKIKGSCIHSARVHISELISYNNVTIITYSDGWLKKLFKSMNRQYVICSCQKCVIFTILLCL